MRTLYFDCFAGASGNMILGALVSAGVDRDVLAERLRLLDTAAFELEFSDVDRSGIACTHADVRVPQESRHRHLSDIRSIIDGSRLSDCVKERANAIFLRLAEAEATVHGIAVEKVHFHEVGALDAIVDIVGACIGFEMLAVELFACSPVNVGSGFVEISHGTFPIPAPATARLLSGATIYSNQISGELITPTGAAIITTLCDSYGGIPELIVEAVGYGAGTRKYEKFPNALRILVGETHRLPLKESARETVVTLTSNIDDASPQILGFVMERAFELGALDCWFAPIQMKKNRPATELSVLCEPAAADVLSEMIYLETTTLGIRRTVSERKVLEREVVTIETEFGIIDLKIGRLNGTIINVMPEYEHIRRAAINGKVPLRTVSEAALAALPANTRTATR